MSASGQVGTVSVINGTDPQTGDQRVSVSGPTGRSEGRYSRSSDEISVTVKGGDPGTRGEATVIHIFVSDLRERHGKSFTLDAIRHLSNVEEGVPHARPQARSWKRSDSRASAAAD